MGISWKIFAQYLAFLGQACAVSWVRSLPSSDRESILTRYTSREMLRKLFCKNLPFLGQLGEIYCKYGVNMMRSVRPLLLSAGGGGGGSPDGQPGGWSVGGRERFMQDNTLNSQWLECRDKKSSTQAQSLHNYLLSVPVIFCPQCHISDIKFTGMAPSQLTLYTV